MCCVCVGVWVWSKEKLFFAGKKKWLDENCWISSWFFAQATQFSQLLDNCGQTVRGLGSFLRRFWIDEIPMLINFLKGDMKLVGVRPLSPHFFSLYSEDLQNLRTQFTPGLIPPFYADLPKTFDEIMESERIYLNLCKKSQFKTDVKYFFLALKNILFKGARSS